jgi:hypothetical protein
LLSDLREYAEVRRLYERVLAGREIVLGLTHQDTLDFVNNLAGLLNQLGEHADLRALSDRILQAQGVEAAAEEAVIEAFRAGGTVPVANRRGRGLICADYSLHFRQFNSVVADVQLAGGGKYFYEIEVVQMGGRPQMGWISAGFESSVFSLGVGVGDDDASWGVDGDRVHRWFGGQGSDFGSCWNTGDIVGCAIDLTSAGAGLVQFSLNGSFEPPHGAAFSDVAAEWVSPGLTCQSGCFRVNFGDRTFRFHAPDESFLSVHDAAVASGSVDEGRPPPFVPL